MNIEDRVMTFRNDCNAAIAELLNAGFNEDWQPILKLRAAVREADGGPECRKRCVRNVMDAYARVEELRREHVRIDSVESADEVVKLRWVAGFLRSAMFDLTA